MTPDSVQRRSLKVWICPECGECLGSATSFHNHWLDADFERVAAEEVEVIPVAEYEGFKERLLTPEIIETAAKAEWESDEARTELSTPWSEAGEQIREEYRVDMRIAINAAIEAAEEDKPHG
jgi:hypothetical protein